MDHQLQEDQEEDTQRVVVRKREVVGRLQRVVAVLESHLVDLHHLRKREVVGRLRREVAVPESHPVALHHHLERAVDHALPSCAVGDHPVQTFPWVDPHLQEAAE